MKNKTREPKSILKILAVIGLAIMFCLNLIAQEPELIVQTGHTDFVNSISFSPDGKILASGSSDRTIKLWDVLSGKELKTIKKEGDILFSPNGKLLAVYGYNQLSLLDIDTEQVVKSFPANDGQITSVAFSVDWKMMASGGVDDTIKVWNLNSGEEIYSFRGHTDDIQSVVFSPDSQKIASGSSDGTIKIWNLSTGKELRTLTGHGLLVTSVVFSPDSKLLASGGWDKTIKLWDSDTGKELKTISKELFHINSVVFSPNGRILASAIDNDLDEKSKSIKLWDISTGNELKTILYSKSVQSIVFSPDGNLIASCAEGFEKDNSIRLWNVSSGNEVMNFHGVASNINEVISSSDGKTFVSGGADKLVKIWNAVSNEQLRVLKGHTEPISSLAFSNDGKILASGSYDSTIRLWDWKTGELLQNLNESEGDVWSIDFSPNDEILISYIFINSHIYKVKIWNWKTKQVLRTFQGPLWKFAFSPNGKTIASGNDKNNIAIWDIYSGNKPLTILSNHADLIDSVTFSPNGDFLASVSLDKTIKLWDWKKGRLLYTFKEHTENIIGVAYSEDGKMLASVSLDGTVKVWNVFTGLKISQSNYDSQTPDKNILVAFPNIFSIYRMSSNSDFQIKKGENGEINIITLKTGKSIASLVALNESSWVITTPDGRFDTNKLENPQGLHWIMPDAPFTPLSFEVFMRDYYEPNLLPRLLRCTEENNCETEFKPVRNLTELNRTQPNVKIAEIKAADAPDVVRVTVEAEETVSEYQRDKQNKPLRSGVQDLRLFRDGQLVGYAPDGEGAVGLDKNGKFTKTFNVRLPKNRDATEFNFTAYAFNSDRVKSETASRVYTLPQKLTKALGSAYIVTIGVNANENRDYDLRYAANDARRLQEELAKRLPKDKYQQIVQIPLVSDYDNAGKLSENNATKAKIKAVLDKLAGKMVSNNALRGVPNVELLRKVLPEDLVLIAFSGHGYANREGIFYLVPYDIGASASGGLGSVLTKSISSDELSLWLRDVDAGEMMMIVDACHSAAAVQGKDFKPGPMGSRGLGQLSYDKGMRILTATQADNVALELGNLQHGLLTYSLVKNGIELGLADYQPKDSKLFSNEWLGFSVKDVPLLYEKAAKGELKDLLIEGKKTKGVELVNMTRQESNLNLQQPSLFDFSRRDRQYELFDIR
jgi:WD40 repeat protein